MNKLHDPELELFKRNVDLIDYARKAGYEPRPHDGAPGLTVLDHPNRDRIVVGRTANGPWIYASVPDYAPRAQDEPSEQALSRLRHAIDRTRDKGSIVEFVQQRDPLARSLEVTPDQVRYRLRSFREHGLPLDFEGALCGPPYGRGRERAADAPRDRPPPGAVRQPSPKEELNRRRYDWTPPPAIPALATDVFERLRRWREAHATREVPARRTAPTASPPAKTAPEQAPAAKSQEKSDLGRRRYDWTAAPPNLEALIKAARNRSPDRGR
jgi:hypothetical protein